MSHAHRQRQLARTRESFAGEAPRKALVATIVVGFAAGLPAACDIPTELPRWQTEWNVTLVADTAGVDRLLPASVRLTADGFVMDSTANSSRVRLGDVCEVCTCFSGSLPPVEITPTDWAVPLPSGVVEARLADGTARMTLHNELSFDLLDDGKGRRGFLVVELTDSRDGEVVRTRTLAQSFPPGDSARLEFQLSDVLLHKNLVARVRGRTPGTGCDSVSLDPESGLRADIAVRDLRADSVRSILSDAALDLRPREIDLPSDLAERLRPGDTRAVLEVDVENASRTTAEVTLSAAPRQELLFAPEASLLTPLPIPEGTPDAPGEVHKRFLLDLSDVPGATSFHLRGRTRITGDRVVAFGGSETLVYTLRLLLALPGR